MEIKKYVSLPSRIAQFITNDKFKKGNELRYPEFYNLVTLALIKSKLILVEAITIKCFNILYFHEILSRF